MTRIFKRLKTIREAERKIIHRVWQGVKGMAPRELAAFIIQNTAEGFARGMIKEVKKS